MNNNPAKSSQEKLTKDIMIQLQEPFLLYKRAGEVMGILFKEANESQRLATKMSALLKDITNSAARESGGPGDAVARGSPATQGGGLHPGPAIGQNSIIRMLNLAAAKQSPPNAAKLSNATDVPRARPQGVTVPQQQQQPQLLTNHAIRPIHPAPHSHAPAAHGAKSGHWSNKTTSISVDYLFKSLGSGGGGGGGGQRSPPRAVSPQTSGPPVSAAALTLSEVEQQALAEASERLRQQLGINVGGADERSGGDQAAQRLAMRSMVSPGSGNNNALQPVIVDDDEEEALVLTPNMIPGDLMHGGDSPQALGGRPEERSGGPVAAMTREQLRMALLTLLEEDDDFLNQIHEGYIRSLQKRLK